ncbi:MAG: ABC transporter permease [Malacoplasma sp.]|nr:ABC transporter permease [Malacoplasma sp.]MDE7099773.1 ABC transporter permease [Malacoplasma sp.]
MDLSHFTSWLLIAPAVMLAALSGYLSERVGIVNIAINGMMIFGALFFMIFSNVFFSAMGEDPADFSFSMTFLLSMLISSILGVGIGALFGFAVIKLKCDHVIGGTGINLLAPGIGLLISDNVSNIFNQSTLKSQYQYTAIQSNSLFHAEALICFLIAILIIIGIFVFMKYSKFGLRYRSIGENPNAADAQGINVNKYKWVGILIVGAIASFAGCLFAYNTSTSSFTGDVNGLGYIALGILIISSWKISPVVIISGLFALLYVYVQNVLGVSIENGYLLKTIPFICALVVMVIFGRFSLGPKSAGKHFNKAER